MNLDVAMRAAIEQADRVKGRTYPNPPVGAVILDCDGEVAGVGTTSPAGGPHAEVLALRRAGRRAIGGTAVVTLEPCGHFGRTPPCVDAIVAAEISSVVYSVSDPNPIAAGGAARLAEAGITVTAAAGNAVSVLSRPVCWPTLSEAALCGSGYTSNALDCHTLLGSSQRASTDAALQLMAPASGSPARPPAPTSTADARLLLRSWLERAPSSSTTQS